MIKDIEDSIKAGAILIFGIIILSALATELSKRLANQLGGIGIILILVGMLSFFIRFIKR